MPECNTGVTNAYADAQKIYKSFTNVNHGCTMKKLYNFRIETTLIKQIDKLNGSRTQNITDALQMYLQNDTQEIYNVNTNYITHLEEEIIYLRNQVNALMVTKMPLLQRIVAKLKNPSSS